MDKFELKKYIYYIIIFTVSLVVLVFMPTLGGSVDVGFNFPTTSAGWFIYILTRFMISFLNIIIFYCFMEQAKINIKDNENYKKANEILDRNRDKKWVPRSPKTWNSRQYGGKGISLFLCSILSTLAFTNAIMVYDYIALLTYVFTLIIGIIFGLLQMKSAEAYWTNEYYKYALMVESEPKTLIKKENKEVIKKIKKKAVKPKNKPKEIVNDKNR